MWWLEEENVGVRWRVMEDFEGGGWIWVDRYCGGQCGWLLRSKRIVVGGWV